MVKPTSLAPRLKVGARVFDVTANGRAIASVIEVAR